MLLFSTELVDDVIIVCIPSVFSQLLIKRVWKLGIWNIYESFEHDIALLLYAFCCWECMVLLLPSFELVINLLGEWRSDSLILSSLLGIILLLFRLSNVWTLRFDWGWEIILSERVELLLMLVVVLLILILRLEQVLKFWTTFWPWRKLL